MLLPLWVWSFFLLASFARMINSHQIKSMSLRYENIELIERLKSYKQDMEIFVD